MGLALSAYSPPFHDFFLFFLSFLHIYLWSRHTSLNFLSCWLLVCGKQQQLALIVCSFYVSVFQPVGHGPLVDHSAVFHGVRRNIC